VVYLLRSSNLAVHPTHAGKMSQWDTSQVTNMSGAFQNARSGFNFANIEDIGTVWDVVRVDVLLWR
jgi:hypothetical protein